MSMSIGWTEQYGARPEGYYGEVYDNASGKLLHTTGIYRRREQAQKAAWNWIQQRGGHSVAV